MIYGADMFFMILCPYLLNHIPIGLYDESTRDGNAISSCCLYSQSSTYTGFTPAFCNSLFNSSVSSGLNKANGFRKPPSRLHDSYSVGISNKNR